MTQNPTAPQFELDTMPGTRPASEALFARPWRDDDTDIQWENARIRLLADRAHSNIEQWIWQSPATHVDEDLLFTTWVSKVQSAGTGNLGITPVTRISELFIDWSRDQTGLLRSAARRTYAATIIIEKQDEKKPEPFFERLRKLFASR